MKKLFFTLSAFCMISALVASDKLTGIPVEGTGSSAKALGKQTITVHSYSGMAQSKENPNNLLVPIETSNSLKWCENSHIFPWVVFELNDIYTIDRFSFLDVKPYEGAYYNVPEYWVYATTATNPTDCGIWTLAGHYKNVQGENIKDIKFDTPVDARYIKFIATRGLRADGNKDNAIRLYGVDIYGTYKSEIDRENVIQGKKVLGYDGGGYLYESPVCAIDGKTLVTSKWTFGRPTATDSLSWAVFDLEKPYEINELRLLQGAYGEKGTPNAKGYNVYISESAPDISKITTKEDDNKTWTKVIDAYTVDRSADSLLINTIIPQTGRYIKIEFPRSTSPTSGSTRVFEFEVYGKEVDGTSIASQTEAPEFLISPNPVKRGELLNLQNNAECTVKIYTMNGTKVFDQTLLTSNAKIQTDKFQAGVYTIQVASLNSKKSTNLIIQ